MRDGSALLLGAEFKDLVQHIGTILFLATSAIVSAAPFAFAWDSYGHMEVACAAYSNLSSAAKQRVSGLLKLNPSYNLWSSWIPSSTSSVDRDMMTFMLAATWPDEIKTNSVYTSDGSHGGNRPEGSSDPSANRGYGDMLMHKYWHFVDTPFSDDGTPLPVVPTPNAGERIALFRPVLSSQADDELKSYDLTWILHLVGDIHQPLHCTTRVSSRSSNGDDGGNDVRLTGSPNELHELWDDLPGTGQPKSILSAVVKAAKKLPTPDTSLAAVSDANTWISESFKIAKENVYADPILAGNGPFTITFTYESTSKSITLNRIALAGARLANLQNNELK